MQKYFEFAIYWDLLLAILLVIFSCFEQSFVNKLVVCQSKLKLLSPAEIQMAICPWEYVKSINIYDPYNYKGYYTDDGKSK